MHLGLRSKAIIVARGGSGNCTGLSLVSVSLRFPFGQHLPKKKRN